MERLPILMAIAIAGTIHVKCETALWPKKCSCVYTCSVVHPSLTWQYYNGMEKEEEVYDGTSPMNDPRTRGCYTFELTNRTSQANLSYNMTSTLTINTNCTSDINNLSLNCSAAEHDVEEISMCLPDQLQAPTYTLEEHTPSSVLITIDPPRYESCVTDYNVTVNGSQCSKRTPVKHSKYSLVCFGLDLYTTHSEFSITAISNWIKSSNTSTKLFKANGTSLNRVSQVCAILEQGSLILNWNAPDNVNPNSQLKYDVSVRDEDTNETIAQNCVDGTTTSHPLQVECICTKQWCSCKRNITITVVPWSPVTDKIESSALEKGRDIHHEFKYMKDHTGTFMMPPYIVFTIVVLQLF